MQSRIYLAASFVDQLGVELEHPAQRCANPGLPFQKSLQAPGVKREKPN